MDGLNANFLDETIKRPCSGLTTKLTESEALLIDALLVFRQRLGLTENKSQLTRQMIDFAFDHENSTFKVPRSNTERKEFLAIIEELKQQKIDNENLEQTDEPVS